MIVLNLDWKSFFLILIIILWMMNNVKIRVIFGELRKILQILPLTKIAQAVVVWYESKKVGGNN